MRSFLVHSHKECVGLPFPYPSLTLRNASRNFVPMFRNACGDQTPLTLYPVTLIRDTVILIEFCAIADAGVLEPDFFPDTTANFFSLPNFRAYVRMAYALGNAFPSFRSADEDNRPQELPSPN